MTVGAHDLDEILETMVSTADETGAFLLDGLGRPKKVEHKGEVDLVTDYDRRAEELIASRPEEDEED